MDVFEHYAPFIQDYIYEHNWQTLCPIQVAAAEEIFTTNDNVLLSASTAAGKTEAAFFPILSKIYNQPADSIQVLYIAPLKALINDQYDRLTELCEESNLKVWRWHGDVAQSQKRKLLKKPSGILQITPESLESFMINKHMDIPHLFHNLQFIVIDELHSFLRSDRGGQTFCLIERLSKLAGVNPRRIGLSATIGNLQAACNFLGAGSPFKTMAPKVQNPRQVWRLSMEHFYQTDPQAASKDFDPSAVIEPKTDQAPQLADPGIGYIFEHTRGRKCLVFTNSREECEAVCQQLREYCKFNHEPDRFLIHHGNLSPALRETAEQAMKDEDAYLTTCATATLELGIDIGQLESAFQIDAPFTVSGFLQRMGRTGRRGNPPEMHFVMREEHPESRAMLPDLIPWSLLQGIALVQLYLEEKWVEPPEPNRLPYSLLYHQTMSTLAASGEMTPAELASRVLSLAYFHNISQKDYQILLRYLLKTDHIQWTENGGLILGLAGERVVNNFKFYAVFQENEEFSVHAGSEELGTIVKPPPVGDKIAIAGRVWVVEDIDRKRHQVYCHGVEGRIPAYFGDVPGDIHPKILQRMKKVLTERTQYPYLMNNAKARLTQMRDTCNLAGLPAKSLINLGGKMWAFFPWTGSYAFLALERLLRIKCADRLNLRGFNSSRPYYMEFAMDATAEEFFQILHEEAAKDFDPMDLVYPKEVPVFDKYDEYLPGELIRKEFAYSVLDIKEMKRCVSELKQ
ncbi:MULTISPECIES: DEAD/DEAH box helicase [Lactobacillus]|uniref:DEAD/DEAH box helicase n=1 Tax=Lactobacillus xujianguonis TaxID=2495899 RepID=A0A437STD4_9LACO|nr:MULTISPECIES: DEAD/DEAH box helicase [Lactobacillus]RVU70206.1 DEAD/DEAH box helicase [Lactobacillus xujianguonis]RVU76919.1 DEAD/DEAH box helicase [Lactobacillus xujianguonis]